MRGLSSLTLLSRGSNKTFRATNVLYSGRKIIQILEKNPDKDPEKYDEDDIAHMRKVVAYCKRHLAQEGKAKQDPNSKSAKSLKNWGLVDTITTIISSERMLITISSLL